MKRTVWLLLTASALLVGAPAFALVFVHQDHQEYTEDEGCQFCHVEDARTIVPDQEVCLNCHETEFLRWVEVPSPATHGPLWGFNHRQTAKNSTYDCSVCHQQDDCFECHRSGFADEMGELGNDMANVHRSEFTVTHPIAARTDPPLCGSCHEPESCRDCHAEFRREDLAFESHRRGFSSLAISPSGVLHEQFDTSQCQSCHPDSVLPTHTWSNNHGREARKNLATCQTCHPQGDLCLKCHSARTGLRINPHPGDWSEFKDRLRNANTGKTCRKCH